MNKLQNIALLVCVLVISVLILQGGFKNIITWDTFGYYLYLPMIFNGGGLTHTNLEYFQGITDLYDNTPYFYQLVLAENGNYFTKYTSGWAVMMSPFYFLGNLICRLSGQPNDGFSLPYQYSIIFGSWFYMILGLYYVKKIINNFFEDKVTALVLLILVFGTNYFFMRYAAIGSCNNLEFTLLAIMIWQTIKYHETYSWKNAVALGFAIGLIGLTRPPDLILALIPFGWNVKQYGNIVKKLLFFFREKLMQTFTIIIIPCLLLLIQFAYWKHTTGHFIINSYANNPGEGMDWKTPYIWQVLFSFRKGWFLYTPIMLLAIIGMFIWIRKNKQQGFYTILCLAIFIYVVSCWTTWWYAESFSQRAMLDIYPLLAIGLGAFVYFAFSRKSILLFSILFLLVSFNLFQTYQIDKGILHTSNITKDYYFSVFGQLEKPTVEQRKLLLIDRGEKQYIGFQNPEDYEIYFNKYYPFTQNNVLDSVNLYCPVIDLKVFEINNYEHFWLQAIYKYEGDQSGLEGKVFNASVLHGGKGYSYNGRFINDSLLVHDSIKKTVTFNYLSPNFRSEIDTIRVNVFRDFGPPLNLKGAEIKLYRLKK